MASRSQKLVDQIAMLEGEEYCVAVARAIKVETRRLVGLGVDPDAAQFAAQTAVALSVCEARRAKDQSAETARAELAAAGFSV